MWHVSGERETGRGSERGVARCPGAALARGRIAERAHQGVRRTDGENRQGSVPGSVLAPAGVGCGNADRVDLYSDDRRPVSIPKSRGVGCLLGLRPGRRNSGESEPQKKISKEGDRYLRTMMVQGAHYILGPFGEDSDLRRWGLKLAERRGKNAKKRAVVAVARKLAVLLKLLFASDVPLRGLHRSVAKEKLNLFQFASTTMAEARKCGEDRGGPDCLCRLAGRTVSARTRLHWLPRQLLVAFP